MRIWLSRHAQVLLACMGRLYANPLSSLMTLSGIGVALSVPLILYVLVFNLSSVFADWRETPRVSVFLELDRDAGFTRELATQLADDTLVERVEVIDREQALAALLEQGSLVGLKGQLEGNPLPDVIELRPLANLDRSVYHDFGKRIGLLDGVAQVQFDLEWVERLRSLTDLAMAAVRVFWVLLFAAVAMVISNSVRLGMVTARQEIEVISLVGGSEPFIRRPYLYLGLLHGILGAVAAIIIAFSVYLLLAPSLSRLLEAYLGQATVFFAPFPVLLGIVLGAGFTGWLAASISARGFLRELLPA